MSVKRKTKITKAIEDESLKLIAGGESDIRACAMVGISRQSMYKHKDRKKQFKDAWKEATEDGRLTLVDRFEDYLDDYANKGSVRAAIRRLQALDPERYGDHSKVKNEISGPGGGPVKLQVDIEWVDAEAEAEASEEA